MEWKQIVEQDRQRLLALHMDHNDDALIWEANRYGIKFVTLKRRLQEMKASLPNPDDTRPSWNHYLRITTDDMVFISDIEIPDQHEKLMEYAKEVGKIYEIPNCMWAGDVNASDQFSNFPVTWQVKQEAYEANIATTRRYFLSYAEVYNQFYIEGNHDNKLNRETDGQVHLGMFFQDMPNFTFSRYPFAFINTSRGLVRVTHPKQFSENAIDLGRKLISKMPIPSHLIMAHTHQGQRGWSKNGVHEIIALGCMRDPLKTQYKNIVDNTYGEWQPGFAMMKNGYFYQLNYFSTDWKSVLKGNLIA